MNTWHKATVKFTKNLEDGTLKRVTENHLFNAINFSEVEARAFEEIGEFQIGEFLVTGISTVNISDIFDYEDSEQWNECVVSYSSDDNDNGKSKTIKNLFLVNADNLKLAYERIEESLKGMMVVFTIESIKKSKILEIFPYKAIETEEE